MGNDTCNSNPKRPVEISHEMEIAEGRMTVLGDRLEKLHAQLEPILRPESPKAEKKEECEKQGSPSTKLGDQIRNLTDILQNKINFVGDISERIEI